MRPISLHYTHVNTLPFIMEANYHVLAQTIPQLVDHPPVIWERPLIIWSGAGRPPTRHGASSNNGAFFVGS